MTGRVSGAGNPWVKNTGGGGGGVPDSCGENRQFGCTYAQRYPSCSAFGGCAVWSVPVVGVVLTVLIDFLFFSPL